MRRLLKKGDYLLIGLLVLACDQWSKYWVQKTLPLHRPLELIPGFLNFTHVENTGVAFGLFAARGDRMGTLLLTATGLIALAVVSIYFWKVAREEGRLLLALALVMGGAVGNLVDRVMTGSVTDFIDAYFKSYHWHTFNVADSAITTGVLLILLDSVFERHRKPEQPPGNRDLATG